MWYLHEPDGRGRDWNANDASGSHLVEASPFSFFFFSIRENYLYFYRLFFAYIPFPAFDIYNWFGQG